MENTPIVFYKFNFPSLVNIDYHVQKLMIENSKHIGMFW